ncbi:MAG: hypothetical protein KDI03_23050, partial [Anaerolineae bacterium]|nr:hypothetical protein [Anaerolineae bacterium]
DTIELPYAADGGLASLPLRQIYAALKADRSSPVERKASHTFFQKLVRQAGGDGRFIDDDLIYQVARLDPYAARFLMYDPRMPAQLRAAHQAEEERTFDMAEILCRHRWLVLLGDPGSGKSTLARWLALHLAQALQQGLDSVRVPAGHVRPGAEADETLSLGPARLPVLIRLADYAAARWPATGVDKRLPLGLFLGRHLAGLLAPGQSEGRMYHLIQDY